MKDKAAGARTEESVRLMQKMYLYLVDDNSKHKKAKARNKNVAETKNHNEYKDVFLNKMVSNGN